MRRIDMKVLLPILGLGALAFALGSSKKAATAAVKPQATPQPLIPIRAGAPTYPSAEGTGDVSDAPVARLVPIKAGPTTQKANGGAS